MNFSLTAMVTAKFRPMSFRPARGVALLVVFCLTVIGQAQLADSGWPIMGGNQFKSNVSSGANAVPSVKWSVPCTGINPVIGIHGEVYLTDNEHTCNVYALDPQTGGILWIFNSGNSLGSYLAVGLDGTVFVSQMSGQGPGAPFGGLFALNGATGAVLWSNTTTGFEAPLPGANGLLFCSAAGYYAAGPNPFTLLAMKASTGETVWSDADWSDQTYHRMLTAIGADGNLLCSSNFGSFECISPLTGAILWAKTLNNNPQSLTTSPAGFLAYETSVGNNPPQDFLCGTDPQATIKWSIPLTNRNNSSNYTDFAIGPDGTIYSAYSGSVINAYDGATGSTLWTLTLPIVRPLGPILDANGVLYLLSGSYQSGNPAVLSAVDTASRSLLWSYALPLNLGVGGNTVAMAADGSIYYADGSTVVAFASAYAKSLSVNPTAVAGGVPVTGLLTLSTGAPPQGGTYQVTSSDGSAVKSFTVQVPAGQTTASFSVPTIPVSSQTVVTLTATPGNAAATLTVNPPSLVSVGLNPTAVVGGNPSTGTVTISSAAPSSGMAIGLSSSASAATVPSSVTIPSGATSATFPITTLGVITQTPATISANCNGAVQTASLTVNPAAIASLTLNPTSVQGGTSSTGTVTLNGAAGPSGVSIALSSGNSAATVPGSVTIASGKSSATFSVATTAVNSQTGALITGTLNGQSQTSTLTVTPATLASLSFSPSTLQGGSSSTGTLTLSGPAGPGGLVVSLSSSDNAATAPTTVTVQASQTSASFTVTTTGVNTQVVATVTATLNGQLAKATLTINPSKLVSLNLNPTSVPGGTSAIGTVTLNGPAAPGGTVVSLSSASGAAQTPGSVTVSSGQTTATFTVTTTGVNSQTSAVISATLNGNPQTTTLTISAPTVSSLTLSPTQVQGGAPSAGQVTLSALAGPGGFVVNLSSSTTSATIPTSVTVPYGQKTASFTVATVPVSAMTYATITGNANGTNAQATLSISATTLVSLSLNPTSVAGVANATGTVTLSGAAGPGGATVNLSSNNPNATVPSSVRIAAGQSGATFTVTAKAVTAATTATISANFGGATKTATLALVPIGLVSLSFNPDSVTGGASSTGTLTLNGPTPKGGLVVKLTSAASTVKVPASVTFLTTQTSVTFKVTTTAVTALKAVTVTAKLGTVSETATLTVIPPVLVSVTLAPASVKGGVSSTGTVTLSGPAPTGGLVVKLSSSLTSAVVPTSVKIAAGSSTAKFTITTKKVTAKATSTIAASLADVTDTATLTITP